ncbi:adenosine deaminase [Hoeflea sp. YIM 152468]|uniref:adenosine deaminase n=1 Tax=Hoeflea sp. YIM 152468 TaxID=3031759 RepID=UPI0023DC9454|nr:adenosine deaminase [Hoeflea sp. YIM 152468]MDF1610369.1 adenosine deaminase [Hoeflea sp. YIM 152468]
MTHAVKKAELHCHIEGAASAALVLAQAEKYNSDISGFISEQQYVWSSFTEFLAAYDGAAALFRSAEDYALLARTYLQSIAAENAIYAEIFVSPDHAAAAGLSSEAYFEGLAEGIAQAKASSGIECRMIIVGIRHLGPEKVEAAARLASTRPHPLITGFGMAGEERFGKVADFARAFDIARDAGLGITIHAGELAGPESVRDALDHVRPARIGHGVRASEDGALTRRIAEAGVVLEVCPGSNLALGLYPDIGKHPFDQLRRAGVKVTLSSDDPPHFRSSVGREYQMAADAWGYDTADLTSITRTAIKAAFVDEQTRSNLLGQLD